MTKAQKSVHTLAEKELAQSWGCQQAKQFPGRLLVLNTWWFCLWIVEHVQQFGKQVHNFRRQCPKFWLYVQDPFRTVFLGPKKISG